MKTNAIILKRRAISRVNIRIFRKWLSVKIRQVPTNSIIFGIGADKGKIIPVGKINYLLQKSPSYV